MKNKSKILIVLILFMLKYIDNTIADEQLIKTNSSLTVEWNYLSAEKKLIGMAMSKNSDDIVVVTYQTEIANPFGIMKLNNQGVILWETNILKTVEDIGAIQVDFADNIVVAANHGYHHYIIKYDSSGKRIWESDFYESGYHVSVYQMELDNDNNVFLGLAVPLTGSSDYCVIIVKIGGEAGELNEYYRQSGFMFGDLLPLPDARLALASYSAESPFDEYSLIVLDESGVAVFDTAIALSQDIYFWYEPPSLIKLGYDESAKRLYFHGPASCNVHGLAECLPVKLVSAAIDDQGTVAVLHEAPISDVLFLTATAYDKEFNILALASKTFDTGMYRKDYELIKYDQEKESIVWQFEKPTADEQKEYEAIDLLTNADSSVLVAGARGAIDYYLSAGEQEAFIDRYDSTGSDQSTTSMPMGAQTNSRINRLSPSADDGFYLIIEYETRADDDVDDDDTGGEPSGDDDNDDDADEGCGC
ncbi:MAG: hypothetical protein GX444_16170 [Myxococcales bacterium]|nr:hypothetical protein [Myxococcales bacterium]